MIPLSRFIRCLLLLSIVTISLAYGQETQIRGFAEFHTTYQKDKLQFGLGEQDLFITSDLGNRFSFLGESVFKFEDASPTLFNVSVERIIIKYNFSGNHNLLVGKHHTPLNYWNDTYHHGRVFFPTIYRPDMFNEHVIPLHTTGIGLQGHDLGTLRFGYDLMVGNGIGNGSNDVSDNNREKAFIGAVHIKPVDGMKTGVSYYHDVISAGEAHGHDGPILKEINQQLFSGSIAYFGKKFEFLAEGTYAMDKNDSTGTKNTQAGYVYAGYRIRDIVSYIRADYLKVPAGELYFTHDTRTSLVIGIRDEINYLTVVKLEFQHSESDYTGNSNFVTAQIAVGF